MNTKDDWKTTVTILDEPRRALWSEVFPGARVPIKCIFTSKVDLPELPDSQVYFLDLAAISDEQRRSLINVISKRFNIPAVEVEVDIDRGVPILAKGVSMDSTDYGLDAAGCEK